MNCPVEPGYEWFPLLPGWLFGRCVNGLQYYPGTYSSILARNDDGSGSIYSVNGVTVASCNALLDQYAPELGHVIYPFAGQYSDTGLEWPSSFWAAGQSPVGPTEEIEYALASVWALCVGQIYAALLCEQIQRFSQFGYYGRKKKPKH